MYVGSLHKRLGIVQSRKVGTAVHSAAVSAEATGRHDVCQLQVRIETVSVLLIQRGGMLKLVYKTMGRFKHGGASLDCSSARQ